MSGGIFRGVRAYIVAVAIICMVAALVATIYFTESNLIWTAFLTGILVASVLAEAARASRSEWLLMRRTAQLSAMKDKWELEVSLRESLDAKIAESQARLRLIDETLPTMVVLVDTKGYCRYHNHAFREWLSLRAEQIDGRHLRDIFGSKAYAEIATAVRQSLDGQNVHYEHLQEMHGGAVYSLAVKHVPQVDSAGCVTGFYFLAEDITKRSDLSGSDKFEPRLHSTSGLKESADQEVFIDKFTEQISGRRDAGKQFVAAIQNGDFCLYCQLISPLPIDSGRTAHYEILIRLTEEEGGLTPPGAFFQLVEKNGLMPYLDRWVVEHVLKWAAINPVRDRNSIFFINVAAATMGDPEFPGFLQAMLDDCQMPGSVLCFEVSELDLIARSSSVVDFICKVRQCGCQVALSGFGRDKVSFDQIRGFQVEFLKIDGVTICNMLNSKVDLAKVISIDHVAKKIGVKTVAELVESEEVLVKLVEIGVDFAQGFGISHPRRLIE